MARGGTLTCPVVLAVLRADTSAIGLTHPEVCAATGLDAKRTSSALAIVIKAGKAVRFGSFKDSRFVVTERAEQCRPAFDAHMAALTEARRLHWLTKNREGTRRYYAKLRAEKPPKPPKAAKAPAAPKPPKAAPKHKQKPMTINAPVTVSKKKTAVNWKDQPAVVPAHVQVQHIPGYTGVSRYRPEPGFTGGFLRAGVGRYEE